MVVDETRGDAGQGEAKRPNILWIVVDEMRWDAIGAYGASVHKTPNIDRLARRGTMFTNAYVNGPECVPARASFMTGKYCKTVDVYNNQMALNFGPERRARAQEIKAKLGPDEWDKRADANFLAFNKAQANAYTFPMPAAMLRGLTDALTLRQVAMEHGVFAEGPTDRMLPELLAQGGGYRTRNAGKVHHNNFWHGFQEMFNHPDENLHTPFGVLTAAADVDKDRLIFLPTADTVRVIGGGVWPLPEARNPDAVRTKDIVEFLGNTPAADKPFLARLSLIWPHTPVLPPEPWDRTFSPDDFPTRPMPTPEELASKSRYEADWRKKTWSGQLPQDELRQAWADYWGLCTYVDELVGRVLDALESSPHKDNTVVVFTADHGVLLGEHGLWQKEHFYEQVVKVPLIFSQPGVIPEGKVIDVPVQHIDIVPTLLDHANVPIPADVEGKSLKDVIAGTEAAPHEYVFSEYVDIGAEYDGWIRRMVSDSEWRLEVTLPNIDGDLDGTMYHLASDHDEMQNLYYDDAAVAQHRARLLGRLTDWLAVPA